VILVYTTGIMSMESFRQWRISINGQPLSEEQRRRWEKEAAYWFELLMARFVPGHLNRNEHCVNNGRGR